MQRLILAGVILMVFAAVGYAADRYWVVGNSATNKCEIVTSNPVIAGDIWFGDGPYTSKADAKLARSTISECPQTPPDEEDAADQDADAKK